MSASLYDLNPVAQVLAVGITLAVGPLAWIWVRRQPGSQGQRLGALAKLTLFLVFDLVLFGAFTRLTDSGLGCPDWPGCYGNASPLGASHEIAMAQAAMPTGPVTFSKAWIEMLHRYFATAVGVLITVSMVASWLARRRDAASEASPGWAVAVFAWVCLQGAFGALTVTMKLNPAIVTTHLLGGYAGLALLTIQSRALQSRELALTPGLRRGASLLLALVVVQSALGGWVSTNYAVLACSEFPRCQGAWWPPMDFANGFTVLRDLGMTASGAILPFEALTAIHYVHRLVAYGVLTLLLGVAWLLLRSAQAPLQPFGWGLAALGMWQFASGLSNVVLDWPLLGALAHTGGAGAMVVVLTALLAAAHGASRGAGPRAVKPAAA